MHVRRTKKWRAVIFWVFAEPAMILPFFPKRNSQQAVWALSLFLHFQYNKNDFVLPLRFPRYTMPKNDEKHRIAYRKKSSSKIASLRWTLINNFEVHNSYITWSDILTWPLDKTCYLCFLFVSVDFCKWFKYISIGLAYAFPSILKNWPVFMNLWTCFEPVHL